MSGRGCFNCGGFGHQAAQCPKAGTPTCYNCGVEVEVGHQTPSVTSVAKSVILRGRAPRQLRWQDLLHVWWSWPSLP
ncbi:hypothetical protein BDV93DRAFT_94007 [Ceratobasidium sp. AG-I]|nr:hypothetical protein BDV93DRAFT_94007 [Ceratobasidium sp. AG-I]